MDTIQCMYPVVDKTMTWKPMYANILFIVCVKGFSQIMYITNFLFCIPCTM